MKALAVDRLNKELEEHRKNVIECCKEGNCTKYPEILSCIDASKESFDEEHR